MIIKKDYKYHIKKTIAYIILIFLVFTTLFPLYIMLSTSIKSEGNILPTLESLIPKKLHFKIILMYGKVLISIGIFLIVL